MKSLFAILALVGASCAPLHAKAAFYSEDQLVERADAIAVIELDAPVACRIESSIWTYQQMAKARVVEPIAGKLPANLMLHGDGSFICGQCPLAKGRYLAFLTKVDTQWTGTNWHLSLRPIRDGKIEWYAHPKSPHELKFQDAKTVLNRVRSLRSA